jgi:hypothetical protein
MSIFSRLLPLFIIIFIFVACDNQQGADTLPTLAILPSATVTDTPTITPTPSETPTETPSNTPTMTLTPTITLSPTQTLTFTPSITPTATQTLTFTPTDTPTQTYTPTQTFTPTSTETPSVPVIAFFQSSATQSSPGSQITLRWSVAADTINLLQLQPGTSTAIQTFVVVPIGSQVVTLPTSGSMAQYRLVASRGGQQTTTDLSITFSCAQTWFFNAVAPGGDCPTGSAINVAGSYQPFERGVMFMYTNQSAVERVCGLQNEDNRYICYDSSWDGSTEVSPPEGPPPSGLSEPDDYFNWAFDSTLASGGKWVEKIGWATSGSPDNNSVTVQYDTQNRLYIRIPSGTYFLNGSTSSGTWTKIE